MAWVIANIFYLHVDYSSKRNVFIGSLETLKYININFIIAEANYPPSEEEVLMALLLKSCLEIWLSSNFKLNLM